MANEPTIPDTINTINVKLKQRIDTESNWSSKNPVLLKGEQGLVEGSSKYKIGDGTTAWNSLPYYQGMSSTDKSKLDGIAEGAQPGTITGIKMNGSSKGTSGVVDLGTVITSHQSLSNYVKKRDNGYSYNNLASVYSGSSAPKYIRISVPKQSSTFTMCMLEITLKADYQNGYYGKILFHGNWSTNNEWNKLKAEVSKSLGSNITMYASDKQYIYITGYKDYVTCTVDKMLIGDSATGKDLSAVKMEMVSELPTTYQTVTMDYLSSTATASKDGLMGKEDKVKLSTTAGSATQPVYVKDGTPIATTYTLNASVPSNAKFTDTNTWRGIQNNLTSDSTTDSLSAAQGKALKVLVDEKATSAQGAKADTAVQSVKIGTTEYKSGTNVVLPAYPTTLPASDVSAWAKASTKPAYTKSEVGLGNVDNTADANKSVKYATSAGNATSATTATKLKTARSIGLSDGASGAANFDGSANANISVTGLKESYLSWGGKNFSDSYGPIDAAMIPNLGANRLAFGSGDGIKIEYSRDSGATWTDYGVSDAQRSLLLSTGISLYIGKADSTNKATAAYMLRVTLDTDKIPVYTVLNKFALFISTDGSEGCYCSIDASLESTPTTWVNFANKVDISGWSGWNIINTNDLITYNNTKTNQYGLIRFTFGCTSGSTTYNGLHINRLMGFGGVGWITPSNMADYGSIYSYDGNQNVSFPAHVTATQFNGKLNGSATTATALTTSAGSATQPVYFSGGRPVATTYTLGKSVPSNAKFTDTWRGIQNNLTSTSTTDSLSAAQGKVLNDKFSSYVPTSRTVNGKALSANISLTASDVGASASGHTHSYAGSSSVGGAAISANALNLISGNEVRFSVKPSAATDIHVGYKWADNTSAKLIKSYKFLDGNAGLANVQAASFIGDSAYTKTSRSGHWYQNIVEFNSRDTVDEIVIKTNIPFTSMDSMPSINIRGYAYGEASPIELTLVFYIYNNAFSDMGCTSTCPWSPKIYLSTYTKNSKKYVAISLNKAIYYAKFGISMQDIWNDGSYRDDYANGWTIESQKKGSNATIIPQTDIATVPYKGIANNITGNAATATNASKVNGHTVSADVPSGAKFTDTVYTHPTSSGNKHIPSGGSSGQILRWSADGTAVWGADNNTTYSNMTAATSSAAGKAGLVPAPGAGKQTSFLRGDGTWVVPTNTTYSTFVKSGSGAKAGLVPAPSTTAGTTKYLREDGTWTVPPNTTYSDATASLHGLMSVPDKKALDILKSPIATCATGRSTAAKVATLSNFTLAVGTTIAVKFTDTAGTANPTSGNLTLNVNDTGAKNIGYFRNGAKSSIIYSSGGLFYNNVTHIFTYDGTYWLCMDWNADNNTTYSVATTSSNGLMSSTDKTKLNGMTLMTTTEFEALFK